ncbi:hypothetical protein [Halobacillus salinus]|uniref:DUF8042 domain-containing protein n=1 Tax=Halobacillus salinus TaxID=192814 RepID=A0A4Z0GX38_9BACI|nr:hypothetical protein [Halobacillus salinus]TGB02360.1 hypothetical protein E4663_13530 [Halobacillus salinus]
MTELTADMHHMLTQYDELLNTVSEGLGYLEKNITEEAPPEAQRVFEDMLLALEQISVSHEQMMVIFEEDPKLRTMVEDFHDVVKLLQGWFSLGSNQEKQQLITEKVLPAYEAWRTRMQAYVKPHIAH